MAYRISPSSLSLCLRQEFNNRKGNSNTVTITLLISSGELYDCTKLDSIFEMAIYKFICAFTISVKKY